MFKTTISYLVILSILLIDVASAMKPRGEEDKRPISRRLSGDFSSSASIETSPKGHKKSQSLGNVVRDETHLPLTDTLQKEKIPASLLQMEQPETSLTLKNEEISQEQKSSLSDQDDLTPPSSPSSGPTHEGERAPSPLSSDEDKNGESSPINTSEGTSPPKGSPSTSSPTDSFLSDKSLQIPVGLRHSSPSSSQGEISPLSNSSSEKDDGKDEIIIKEAIQNLHQLKSENATDEILPFDFNYEDFLSPSTKEGKLEANKSALLPPQNTIENTLNKINTETITHGLLEETRKIREEIGSILDELAKIMKAKEVAEKIITDLLDSVQENLIKKATTLTKKVTQPPLSDENSPLLRKESKEESLLPEQMPKFNLTNGNGKEALKITPYPLAVPPKEGTLVGKISGSGSDQYDMESGAKTNVQPQVGPKGSLNAEDEFVFIESDEGSMAAFFPNDKKGNLSSRKFKACLNCCGKQLKSENESILVFATQKDLKEGDFKDLQNLPPHAKAHLKRITEQEIEGKLTKIQWLGIIIGTGIAGWMAYGMSDVYDSGLDYLGFKYAIFGVNPWMTIYNGVQNAVIPYVIPTVLLDALLRNTHLWKKGLTALKEDTLPKGRVAITALTSFLPSILEPFYLILLATEIINSYKYNGETLPPLNEYTRDMLIWTWPLLMDSWAANFNFAWGVWDKVKEWPDSTKVFLSQHILKRSLHTRLPLEDELMRRDFTKNFEGLESFIYRSGSKADIKTLYQTIHSVKDDIKGAFPDLEEADLQNAQAFFTLRHFLSIGDQIKETKKQVKSWYNIITDCITGTFLVTSSPFRLLVFELIVESITNLVPGKAPILRSVINWGIASIIWTIQTVFEGFGMNAFFKNFLAQEDPHGHRIYPGARIPAKIYAAFQAFIYTIPLGIAVLQVCNKWNMDPLWMIGAATFLFAEFATQASSQWGWSTQQEVSLFARIHNMYTRPKLLKKSPRTQFKRDQLIEMIQTFKNRLPYLHPEILQKLKETLEIKSFEEV